jgi:NADPH:quinone reductase-like Zn-dependent oxidoreductase
VSGRDRPSVLILGGTSATGMVAIMLAKKMGLRITTTCSGTSRDIVEKLGATEVSRLLGLVVPTGNHISSLD